MVCALPPSRANYTQLFGLVDYYDGRMFFAVARAFAECVRVWSSSSSSLDGIGASGCPAALLPLRQVIMFLCNKTIKIGAAEYIWTRRRPFKGAVAVCASRLPSSRSVRTGVGICVRVFLSFCISCSPLLSAAFFCRGDLMPKSEVTN